MIPADHLDDVLPWLMFVQLVLEEGPESEPSEEDVRTWKQLLHRYLEVLDAGLAPRPTRDELMIFLMSSRDIVREDAMMFLTSWVDP